MPPVSTLRRALLDWYDRVRRDLPWRAAPGEWSDPYRVWLSEVMLQQTTVPHATRYFLAFTARWPTVRDLAAANDADVMAAWAGLGYYARARNLLACARAVARDHGGAFPSEEAALRALPGLGPYTAAAVAAIAFDRAANVVDGNVERLMARLHAVETPLPAARAQLRDLAGRFVTDERPGDWAQALMDLGATVCRPRGPLCEACPLARRCAARAAGTPEAWPKKVKKAARPHRHGVAFVLLRAGEAGLVRRPPRGLLGGMLGLPTTPWRAASWSRTEAAAHAPAPGPWRAAGAVEHVFTHFSLTLEVLTLQSAPEAAEDLVWMEADAAGRALPSVFAKALTREVAGA
jgi:A/G-specific adenine glycosylase